MKLVYKTLHRKQRFTSIILVCFIFLTLLSTQIAICASLKNYLWMEEISDKGMAQSNAFGAYHDFYKDLDQYNALTEQSFTYEKTYAYPYSAFPGSILNNPFHIYLEGYVKSDDNYQLIEGKKLSDLKDNEIAVMDSYAKQLKEQGINPIDHIVTLPATMDMDTTLEAGEANEKEFVIKSVFNYPNYDRSYSGQSFGNSIRFQATKPAVGIASLKTVEELCKGDNGNSSTFLAKVHFKDYSVDKENSLRTGFYGMNNNIGTSTYNTDFRLLLDEQKANQVYDGIFAFVSISISACLVLSCIFVLYAFMKKKLLEDRAKLSILIANGIFKKNIRKAYMLEEGRIFFMAIGVLIIFDVLLYFTLQLQTNYLIETLFQITSKGVLLEAAAIILLLCLLFTILISQVHSCYKKNLSSSVKEKQLKIKHRWKPITHRSQLLHMSKRDIVTRPFSSIRNIFSISIILLTMMFLMTTQSILSHLYTPDTFGLKFDYFITSNMKWDDFDQIQQSYIDKYAFFNDAESAYLVNDKSWREIIDVSYYPGIFIMIQGDLKDFLTLKDGKYPPIANGEFGEGSYSKIFSMISRRTQHDFNIYYESSKEIEKNKKLATRRYISFSDSYGSWLNSFPVYGYTESIINNGYVAFGHQSIGTVDKDQYENTSVPSQIITLKDKDKKAEFEDDLKSRGITYTSYDEILTSLQNANNSINSQLFYIMIAIAGICIFVASITLYANINADIQEKEEENSCYLKIGMNPKLLKRREILQQLLMLTASFILAFILYAVFQLPYFNQLGIYVGLYTLPSANPWCLGFFLILLAFSMITTIVLAKKRK